MPEDAYGRLRRCGDCCGIFPTAEQLDVAAFNRRLAREGYIYDPSSREVKRR